MKVPRFEAPVAVLRERAQQFARRSADRPLYLGILIAIVAALSIALGMVAGRALGDADPISADPSQHGQRADSVFGTSTSNPPPGDELPGRDARTSPDGEPGRRSADNAADAARRTIPGGDLRQSAAGSVAPRSVTAPPARTPEPASARARQGDTRRPAVMADSLRDSATGGAIDSGAIARDDSVRRDSLRDSARRDSAVQRGDSLPRPAGGNLPGDTLLLRQRNELQRELADRQRRIDSLQRWLDSVRRTPPPSPPPR